NGVSIQGSAAGWCEGCPGESCPSRSFSCARRPRFERVACLCSVLHSAGADTTSNVDRAIAARRKVSEYLRQYAPQLSTPPAESESEYGHVWSYTGLDPGFRVYAVYAGA